MKHDCAPGDKVDESILIDLIANIIGAPLDADIVCGMGDDAAVYVVGDGRVHVVSTDVLVEDVHFDRAFTPMDLLGQKAIAVSVSDIVAMNAIPRLVTVALGLPDDFKVESVKLLYQSIRNSADAYGATIVGGDTTRAPALTLSVTVIGEAKQSSVVYRSGAQTGDALCVTGEVGASHAGLTLLRRGKKGGATVANPDQRHYVAQRHLAPCARLDAIRDWADRGAQPHALIDISDGLASEIHHLCRASKCGAHIYVDALPIAEATRAVASSLGKDVNDYALYGGEDYALLFALPTDELDRLDPDSFSSIGRMTGPKDSVTMELSDGQKVDLPNKGYRHFG